MPGPADAMAGFGARKQLQLGAQVEAFIAKAAPDFTHMTVLLYLVKESRSGSVSVGEICKVTGDPKSVVQGVLERFVQLELLRISEGLLTKKYAYEPENPSAAMVSKVIKLWENRETHQLVLKLVLAGEE